MISEIFPSRIESVENMHKRTTSALQYIHDYGLSNTSEASADESQIAVVGHSHFFTYLTATEWYLNDDGSRDQSKGPKQSVFMNNCEFVALDGFLPLMTNL